ncbi:MAG: DNA polymerase III subunit delta [Streptococcaceae bacterium]|jgi:DNA polymerase-3 subunit delta|nr:DNA polymerase III subunit delta [Streptococcaceae bacterium]
MMAVEQQIKKIKNGQLDPIYVVVGTEVYLKEKIKQVLKKTVLSDAEDEVNFITLDGKVIAFSKIMEEAQTLPFFGEKRLLFVENAWFLTSEKVSGVEFVLEMLIDYINQPLMSTVLVFLTPNSLDGKKKVVKLLKKQATIVDISPANERDVRSYLDNELKQNNFQIDSDALNLLILLNDRNGKTFDLSKALSDLSTLMLYKSKEKIITKQDVETVVPKNLEYNIFDLSRYILNGEAEKALRLFSEILLQGKEVIVVNAILLSQIRLFLQVKILSEQGCLQGEMAKILNINSYRVKLAYDQMKSFSLPLLTKIFDELVENDYKMKTGAMEKELLFQLSLLDLFPNRLN